MKSWKLEINHRRAVLVLGRIDEILSWEKTKEQAKDVRFVELKPSSWAERLYYSSR